MKAITIYQPWATLIALGVKSIETRSWSTNYRGPLAIHAGKQCLEGKFGDFEVENDGGTLLLRGPSWLDCFIGWPYRLPLGEVVCIVDLREVVPSEMCVVDASQDPGDWLLAHNVMQISRSDFDLGDYSPGRFAWATRNKRRVKPIPCRGAQGLWNLPPDVVQKIEDQPGMQG